MPVGLEHDPNAECLAGIEEEVVLVGCIDEGCFRGALATKHVNIVQEWADNKLVDREGLVFVAGLYSLVELPGRALPTWSAIAAVRSIPHLHQTTPSGLAASAVRGIGVRSAAPKFATVVTPSAYGANMSSSRLRRSAGGVTSLGLHLVWCTKYRHRILGGRFARRLEELLTQIAEEHQWEIVASEVMFDHVHIFLWVRPTGSPADVVRAFKGRTSRILRSEFPWLGAPQVLWSKSYFGASVGYVSEQTVRRCIEHQWDKAA